MVGAHLSGEPLNHQLTMSAARFVRATRTAPVYRLFALPNTTPAKPGLVRVARAAAPRSSSRSGRCAGRFGRFVARVPPPLCIGSSSSKTARASSAFSASRTRSTGATDISHFGGWRAFLRSLN